MSYLLSMQTDCFNIGASNVNITGNTCLNQDDCVVNFISVNLYQEFVKIEAVSTRAFYMAPISCSITMCVVYICIELKDRLI